MARVFGYVAHFSSLVQTVNSSFSALQIVRRLFDSESNPSPYAGVVHRFHRAVAAVASRRFAPLVVYL